MACFDHNISSKLRLSRKLIISVLIFIVIFYSLTISMAAASEEEPSKISLKNFEYRLGNPPNDEAGLPLWVNGNDSGNWSPYQTGTYIKVPEAVKYIWFRITLPENDFHGPVLRFYDVGNSMDMYMDGQMIYSNHYLEQPGLRRIFEYYYSRYAKLPDGSAGKTVYIRAVPKALFNKNGTYVLDILDLLSYETQIKEMLDSGLLNMILGFILLAAGLMFLLLLLFVKVNPRTMLSFGMLSITSGIVTLFQSYIKYIIGVPTLFYYLAFISNTLMPVAVCQLFKQYVKERYKKLADIFSLVFAIYSPVMMVLDLAGLCSAYAVMPVFFAFFAVCSATMFVLVLKNHKNSRTETRIIVIGSIGYCLTGLYDIIYVMIINHGDGSQYHIWGLIALIVSLVFSMVYRYNETHKKALEYSGELEEKNRKLNEAWSEVKTAHDNIAELNRSLEQKVQERTEQLKDANSELTEVNEELTAMNEQLMATMDALTDAQAQLIQTEKIAALGKLVAGVAHELNTPVAAISSNIQFEETLLDQVDPDDISSMRAYFASIGPLREVNREAGDRISNIVRNLTNFSRLDESDLKEVNLIEGLDSTVIILGEEIDSKKVTINKEFSYIPSITCYPKLMNQVFMDLLENAIETVHIGGTITIGTSCTGNTIRISFKDNGKGIPPEDLQKVFDPRFTTKGERVGIGLGLPLSYRIVEKHGGSINVTSSPGEGSEFVILLPCDRHAV